MDFEVDRLDDELVKVGFDSGQSAFYSWLGAIYHLTPEAIRKTLDRVTEVSTTGSRIVFDFKIAKGMLSQEWRTLCGKMEGPGRPGRGHANRLCAAVVVERCWPGMATLR